MKRCFLLVFSLLAFSCAGHAPLQAQSTETRVGDDEFHVVIDNHRPVKIIFENRWLRVRHGSAERTTGAILELLDKRSGYDAAGNDASIWQTLDNSDQSAEVTSARVVHHTPDEISVEINWGTGVKKSTGWDGANKREIITLYRDSVVLRLHYITKWHVAEWGAERTTGDGSFAILGVKEYQELRGLPKPYFLHKEFDIDKQGLYYDQERDGLDVPLNDHGQIVMGVVNSRGCGYVRVMGIAGVPHLKLMGPPPCGFEMYRVKDGTVGYLAPIKGGREEVESLGHAIALWADGGPRPIFKP